MTKKDYELIAAAIKRQRDTCERFAVPGRGHVIRRSLLEVLATDLAGELTKTNPRFNQRRFLMACGIDV